MRECGKWLPSTATSYEDRMLKCSASMEVKEGRQVGCCFESDGEREVEVEEAWTRWAFSVFRRPDQSLEMR
jgi:hypothetical protein